MHVMCLQPEYLYELWLHNSRRWNIFEIQKTHKQKNLRDFMALTGVVILPKSISNRQFFGPCDLEIWQMTSKNSRDHFHAHRSYACHFIAIWEFKLELPCGKRSSQRQIFSFSLRVKLKFHGWSWKTIGYLFDATSKFVYHFEAIYEFNLQLQSRNAEFG